MENNVYLQRLNGITIMRNICVRARPCWDRTLRTCFRFECKTATDSSDEWVYKFISQYQNVCVRKEQKMSSTVTKKWQCREAVTQLCRPFFLSSLSGGASYSTVLNQKSSFIVPQQCQLYFSCQRWSSCSAGTNWKSSKWNRIGFVQPLCMYNLSVVFSWRCPSLPLSFAHFSVFEKVMVNLVGKVVVSSVLWAWMWITWGLWTNRLCCFERGAEELWEFYQVKFLGLEFSLFGW